MALSFLMVIFRSWSKCWWSMSSHVGCFSLEKHVTKVSATCFLHHLHRLRHIWRILTAESVATLVHAFVTSRMDYCNVVLACAPKVINNVWWMQQSAFWLVPGSLTEAWHSWCTTISTGLTCLSASSIKSSSWLVAVSSIPHLGI